MAKLYFRYGAMGAGKSTMLMQVAHNYEEKGLNVLVVKSVVDTKGEDKLVSRMGLERKVDVLLQSGDILHKAMQFHKLVRNHLRRVHRVGR